MKVFSPTLNNKPVIVLSNNDGCVIARSQEVKDLGIPMGIPVFKIKHLVEIHDIQIFHQILRYTGIYLIEL